MTGASRRTVWVLSDGKPGMENQCLGLAEALGRLGAAEAIVKRISPRFPWSVLPPQLWVAPLAGLNGDALVPPWPDILIATGRQTVAPALAIKKASAGKTFCVQIQNPVAGRDRFDLLAIPRHDRVDGANVIVTDGALHRIVPDTLAAEADRLHSVLAALPRPLVAVLIGGSNGQYKMTEAVTAKLAADLSALCRDHGAGLAVTASRRTGAVNEKRLRDALDGPACWFWDGTGDNPYFGLLGLADTIVVTADSVSMVSEACATGKPVHVMRLGGRGSRRFDQFFADFVAAGYVRWFTGALDAWQYDPPQETARAAEIVRQRLTDRAPDL